MERGRVGVTRMREDLKTASFISKRNLWEVGGEGLVLT